MAEADASKANKRRSLLMPKGTLVGASSSRMASPTKQPRPVSMLGTTQESVRYAPPRMQLPGVREHGASTASGSTGILPSGLRKPASRIAPGASKTGSTVPRASGLQKPKAVGGLHSRQQSVTRPASTPAQSPVRSRANSRTIQGRTGTDDILTGATRIGPATGGGPRASTSRIGHSRAGSIASLVNHSLTEPQTQGHPVSRLQRPASMLVAPGNRPAFSTLQQHYSPLKARATKPVSSSLINPPVPEAPTPVSAETSFLQTHLMQLAVLHASFQPTYNEWCAAARHAMRRKFADVAARTEIIQEQERQVQGQANLEALNTWGGGKHGALGENIQTLANVIQDVDILCDERGGKVVSLIEGFDGWLEAVRELWALRSQIGDNEDAETALEFVDGLGTAWRQDIAALLRRLGGMKSMIDGLERPPAGSTAAEVVDCVGEILRNSVEELDLMSKIERLVGEQEKAWVDARLDRVIASLDLDDGEEHVILAERPPDEHAPSG